ncbi:MAG: sporulation protein YqfD [Eubacteriales bacterium]|nr:sporulation protein YqfD [Eubacteriales bacterium]
MLFNGRCLLRITGSCPCTVLNRCAAAAIDVHNAKKENEYVLTLEVREAELDAAISISEKCMCDCEVMEIKGGSSLLSFLKNHIWFLAASSAVIALVLLSSLFVWEIRVTGNDRLSDGEILRALSECGVDIGTYRADIKNDIIRNEMLLRLPEIAWMSVNFSGSRATVLVSERLEKPEVYDASVYTDVISKADGIVKTVRTLNGTALVSRGQSVLKGEKLIDGRIESITAPPGYVNAFGSVIARTRREESAVSPVRIREKTEYKAGKNRFALRIGKRKINFYLNGGKPVDECDKIIHNYKIGKKGVFSLPLTLVHEKILPYTTETVTVNEGRLIGKRLSEDLRNEIDGEILSESISQSADGELLTVTARWECLENIAETVKR